MGVKSIDRELNGKVEDILYKIKPGLGGADVRLKNIGEGVVRLDYLRPLSPYASKYFPVERQFS